MTAKQYLQSYKRLKRRYVAMVEQIKSIENEMISLRSPILGERVQSSPKKDPIGEMVCALEREKGTLGIRLTECKSKMMVIQSQIEEMDKMDNDYYIVLLFRYVFDKDWRFICDNLHLSRAQANVVHGRALQEFDSKFGTIYVEK